ncbi:hypothetical protein Bp8pS_122 [Bacillus phage vB_BpuM-BpSp]|nr:hypothetical protein Bp8pS_122 [Bacillus phage vB_BpuM-BpSp]
MINKNKLNEDYYSKDSLLRECEDLISSLKENSEKIKSFSESQEIKRINEILQSKFNIKNVELKINEKPYLFASVESYMPLKDILKVKSFNIVKTNKGIRFKDQINDNVLIIISRFSIEERNPQEIMSMIMHEVGHLFFERRKLEEVLKSGFNATYGIGSLIKVFDNFKLFKTSTGKNKIIYTLNMYDFSSKFLSSLTRIFFPKYNLKSDANKKSSDTFSKKYYSFLKNLDRKIPYITSPLGYLGKFVSNNLSSPKNLINPYYLTTSYIGSFINAVVLSKKYDSEKFADDFAISYGYSVDLVKTLIKDKNYRTVDIDKPAILATEIVNLKIASLLLFVNFQPSDYKRIILARQALMREVKNTKSSSDRKELLNQIAEIDELIKNDDFNMKKIKEVHSFLGIGNVTNFLYSTKKK